MSKLEHVLDGSTENFQQLVIQNSMRGTVLVNYWTPNAGPCFKLWQVLERLSIEYNGRFLLVNVNTDTQKRLARENGITSVPTIKVYRNGEVVESVYGAQSEAALRTIIENHVPPAQSTEIAEAIRAYQTGHTESALATLVEASRRSPDDARPHATAMKLLLREKRFADIDTWYSALPEKLRRQSEISNLQAHARLLHLAETAQPVDQLEQQLDQTPDDVQTIMSLAACKLVTDETESALDYLLVALQADRRHEDELPRRAMLAIFTLLGDKHEITVAYKKRLRDLLH